MHEHATSRRTVLRAGGALGVAALAGCIGDGVGGEGGSSPADEVPAGAKVVVHVAASTLLNDDQLRSRVNEFLGATGDQMPAGEDVESLLDQVETSTGLDPRALQRATLFAGYEPTAPSGLRFEAGWEESAVREALAAEASSETYNDQPVYRSSESSALGVLEDSTFVVGTAAGVEGAIDVAAGDADPVSGRVREAFAAAPVGPIRFGFESPSDLGDASSSGPVDAEALAAITHGYGAYTVDGDQRSTNLSGRHTER